jgi:hypothetical protein
VLTARVGTRRPDAGADVRWIRKRDGNRDEFADQRAGGEHHDGGIDDDRRFDRDGHRGIYGDVHRNVDRDGHRNTNPDRDIDADGHSNTDGYPNTNPDHDGNADADTDGNTDTDLDGNSDRDIDRDTDHDGDHPAGGARRRPHRRVRGGQGHLPADGLGVDRTPR